MDVKLPVYSSSSLIILIILLYHIELPFLYRSVLVQLISTGKKAVDGQVALNMTLRI